VTAALRPEFADAETLAERVALLATRSVGDGYTWQRFGYEASPSPSPLLLHLMARERLEGETFLLRELAVASIVMSVRALRADLDAARRRALAARAAELAALRQGVARWLRCATPRECALVLAAGIGAYFGSAEALQAKLLYGRAAAAAPRAVNGRWREGGTEVFSDPDCFGVRAAAYLHQVVPERVHGEARPKDASLLEAMVRGMD
jgi:hypothetical protein